MTVSLSPPPLDSSSDEPTAAAIAVKLEPKPASTFTPFSHLSSTSSRKDIYAAIDSLSSFHAHHSHFHPAPEWDRLYACVRSYKKSHPDIPDIATAFQHHRRQVLGTLSEDERTPSIDRLRKRRDRQQHNEKARKQQRVATAPAEAVTVPQPLTADLSASVALSSIHSAPAASESGGRCGCGTMVEANRRLQEELRRKDAHIAALQSKLTQLRAILDGDEAASKQQAGYTTSPTPVPAASPSPSSDLASSGGAVSAQTALLSPFSGPLASSGSGASAVAGSSEWPEFYPSLVWPTSGDVQCSNCTCCSWKLD